MLGRRGWRLTDPLSAHGSQRYHGPPPRRPLAPAARRALPETFVLWRRTAQVFAFASMRGLKTFEFCS